MTHELAHPLIYSYLKKYQEDPTSRVFAPLAEAYRKVGLLTEAIDIAREGLKLHPQFLGGRVALARALFDQKLYLEVIEELAPIVQDIPDNLVAQKLLADSYLILGRLSEALIAYKMLLFFSPQDGETAKLIQELESQAYENGTLVLKVDPAPLPQFDIRSAETAIENGPDEKWDKKINKIEMLQALLQNVERYRVMTRLRLR